MTAEEVAIMSGQTLTLNLPGPVFARLEERARAANRTVEAELLDLLTTSVPAADALPDDLAEAVAPLALLDDDALWRAARSRLAAEAADQIEAFHLKRQREGLTEAEVQTLTGLMRQYERAMLVRARAAALLHQRGHDVSALTAS
jgi:hypothetical protein